MNEHVEILEYMCPREHSSGNGMQFITKVLIDGLRYRISEVHISVAGIMRVDEAMAFDDEADSSTDLASVHGSFEDNITIECINQLVEYLKALKYQNYLI